MSNWTLSRWGSARRRAGQQQPAKAALVPVAIYSSIRYDITHSYTLTVRKWLSTQSHEAQREFGLLAIENVTKGFW
ncbi:hypothetical protein F0U62_28285 [Cystobacter fuscus]|uniref:hypothetical protein n=1 Tax=Cystobacter fuscus TaxID=43 RepID=UPI002B2C2D27|nr:hypothetical protein F0U62_28285 [Cystobacter fuscus]